MPNRKPILETKNLKKSFGAVVAANNVNVSIFEGEVVGIVGSNGAGKTTFCNIVTGHINPDSGKILFNNKDITNSNVTSVKAAGIHRSFQIPQLFGTLDVMTNILLALSVATRRSKDYWRPLMNKSSQIEAYKIIEQFNINNFAYEKVNNLSQGTRKILDIAIAMIGNPYLVLLDEPTSGISSEEKFKAMDSIVNGIKKSNVTTLFIEHDMEIVKKYSRRVIAFYDGKIIADDKTKTALNNDLVKKYITGLD